MNVPHEIDRAGGFFEPAGSGARRDARRATRFPDALETKSRRNGRIFSFAPNPRRPTFSERARRVENQRRDVSIGLDVGAAGVERMKPVRVWLTLPDGHELERFDRALEEADFAVAPFAPADVDELALARDGCDAWVVDASSIVGGLEELEKRVEGGPALILVASFGTIADAVEAMRRGAADYLTRPITAERLIFSLRRALDQRALRLENARLQHSLADRFDLGRIVSRDPRMLEIKRLIESVADTRAHLLISGESGTGKTLLARTIHQRSSRATEAFVEVNCGALPTGLLESELFGHVRGAFTGATKDKLGRFEAADGGTLFLDEISNAAPELQVKLLRVIQDKLFERVGDNVTRSADVRVIAATNRDLKRDVADGKFREDLYWRLAVVPIHLPPLRERPKDVALLAETFVESLSNEYGRKFERIAPDALAALCSASWPGNVRELENTLERAVLLGRGPELRLEDLGSDFLNGLARTAPSPRTERESTAIRPLKEALASPERELIERALRSNGGNRKRTAEMLGVNRTTLFNKMRKYGLLGRHPSASRNAPLPGQTLSHPAL